MTRFIFKFSGGIGNQIFQYNFFLTYFHLDNVNFYFDLTDYHSTNNLTKRIFYLEKILPKNRVLIKTKLHLFLLLFKSIFFNLTIIGGKSTRIISLESIVNFLFFYRNSRTFYLKGYWQNKKISDQTLHVLRKIIPVHERNKKFKNYCFFHFRLTDYLTSENTQIYKNLDTTYYKKALKELVRKEGLNLKIVIFTDDIIFFKKFYKVIFDGFNIQINQDKEPLSILSSFSFCRSGVIANSTFSFIGALLSHNKNIFYPSDWYTTKDNLIVFPKTWIKI
ncbi:alpha-1,2-fucosyltransferase [Methylophilaceae bacterium]|nr:alpha-1,2-fucosyltransferase [Methylophilaceae bacterium]